jgi:radical SAM protein with 4Fe4S-binding SPASM domain
MLSNLSQIHFPDAVEVSCRNREYVYWAPRRRVAVKVGPAGDRIFQTCREESSVAKVVESATRSLKLSGSQGEAAVLEFLNKMIELDFLSENPVQPQPKPAQPRSAFKPVVMYLHLTVHCNLSCSYCYNVEHREAEKHSPALTLFEHIDLIEEAADRGIKQINFTGGEPLLSRNWATLARRAKARGLSTGLLSNGAVINDRNAGQIAELFDKTIISLDSAIAEEHDAQRGCGSHASTMRGIAALRRAGYKGLSLRPVLTRHNLDSLPLYPAFAAEHCGTTEITLAPYAPNSVEEERALQLLPTTEKLRSANAAFHQAMQSLGINRATKAEAEFKTATRCGAGSGIVSVDFNGDVYPCQAIHDPATKMGNVREQSLFSMGDSGPAVDFRAIDHSQIDICKTCNFNDICGGGCRAVAFSIFRKITAHNRYSCDANKADAWDRIWAGLAAKPIGSTIDPASSSCSSGSCSSACS